MSNDSKNEVNSKEEVNKEVHKLSKLALFSKDFLFGGVVAAFSTTLLAPVERIKILLQVQYASEDLPPEKRYKGIFDAAKRIPQEQGFKSFWRGNGTNVIRYFPTQAMNFAFKDYYQSILQPPTPSSSKLELIGRNMLAGAAAGATSLLAAYPLDLARTRLSSDVSAIGKITKYNGMFDCIKSVYKTEGFFGLYRGFGISVIGIAPYRAIYFGVYDTLKQTGFLNQNSSVLLVWVTAQSITFFSQVCAYPFDTVRRRLQTRGGGDNPLYNGTFHCIKQIWTHEGFRGFYKGVLANSIRSSAGALCLVLYDYLQKVF